MRSNLLANYACCETPVVYSVMDTTHFGGTLSCVQAVYVVNRSYCKLPTLV